MLRPLQTAKSYAHNVGSHPIAAKSWSRLAASLCGQIVAGEGSLCGQTGAGTAVSVPVLADMYSHEATRGLYLCSAPSG